MTDYTIHNIETAPEQSKPLLEGSQKSFGMIPNLHGVMAESPQQQQAFFEAGYTNQHILDIVLILSQKVMSNYVNHLAETPVDKPFQAFEWQQAS